MKLRKAEMDDISFIAEVCLDNAEIYDSIMPGAFVNLRDKFLKNGLPDDYDIKIVEVEGHKIGFVGSLTIDDESRLLVGLYLLKKSRRIGYGTQILKDINRDSVKSGFKELVLLVHQNAPWAYEFYKKNGFEVIASTIDEVVRYNKKMGKYYIHNTYLMSYLL